MNPSSFRWTSTILLVLLVVGTIGAFALVSFAFVTRQNDVTQHLIAEVHDDLVQAVRHRERADEVAAHVSRLQARRLRLSILIETCVVTRLRDQELHRCDAVRQRASRLVRRIRRFRRRLVVVQTQTQTQTNTNTNTRTQTQTRTTTISATSVTPAPKGCPSPAPPGNPHCEGES